MKMPMTTESFTVTVYHSTGTFSYSDVSEWTANFSGVHQIVTLTFTDRTPRTQFFLGSGHTMTIDAVPAERKDE